MSDVPTIPGCCPAAPPPALDAQGPAALCQEAAYQEAQCLAAEAEAALRPRDAAGRIAWLLARFPGRLAVVSSFGADSAVLLHLVAGLDPALPVLFLETGRLFPETLAYRDALAARLGLRGLRSLRPDPRALAREDALGGLWAAAPDRCCALRKVAPLDAALAGFTAWINGRKRFQSATRAALPLAEATPGGKVSIAPLADWDAARIEAYRRAHALPAHPLVARGYPSIGCQPCTSRVAPGEDQRAGRWRGQDKTECGIHRPAMPRAPSPIRKDPV
ncbi:phosphoadenylyl-sulfate reductase [Roseomonas sp. GC11]|uniref:phosphoadenylyl-sulfate reductase n=1 Tax=Roseomonas sp. GC11 TaxID=2950546 RepID=UPI00210ADA4D|nr:phosphoadenylyl-sulfate reductase [Roseomonas sp. GC11]MCQ4159476.1 phosphoadenylyl-sulfate reductase [Roseomonas sp. GC11]